MPMCLCSLYRYCPNAPRWPYFANTSHHHLIGQRLTNQMAMLSTQNPSCWKARSIDQVYIQLGTGVSSTRFSIIAFLYQKRTDNRRK